MSKLEKHIVYYTIIYCVALPTSLSKFEQTSITDFTTDSNTLTAPA